MACSMGISVIIRHSSVTGLLGANLTVSYSPGCIACLLALAMASRNNERKIMFA